MRYIELNPLQADLESTNPQKKQVILLQKLNDLTSLF